MFNIMCKITDKKEKIYAYCKNALNCRMGVCKIEVQ